MLAEVRDMKARSGPFFQDWRRAHAAAVGAVLVDELDSAE